VRRLLAAYAMEISDLVALAKKQHFAETFIPAFAGHAEAVLASKTTREVSRAWPRRVERQFSQSYLGFCLWLELLTHGLEHTHHSPSVARPRKRWPQLPS